jgi:protein involved in polysaccharide export with SLBB domain/capsular polysaccharide biosynthesis protein/Mrp family chromosome partitioning ATPase
VVIELLLKRWGWLGLGLIAGGLAFFLLGTKAVQPKFTASAQLLRYEVPGKSDYFHTPPLSPETFSAIIRSPDLLLKVGQLVQPPIPPESFAKIIKVEPEPDSDIVNVHLAARDPSQAVALLNLYLTNAVAHTRELEAKQAAALAQDYLQQQLSRLDADIDSLQTQFRSLPLGFALSNRLERVSGKLGEIGTRLSATSRPSMSGVAEQARRLQTAMGELNDLLLQYTELHPKVQAKRAQIDSLQSAMAESSTNSSAAGTGAGSAFAGVGEGMNPEADIIHIKLRTLEDGRLELSRRQREAELYAQNPPGSVRIHAPATSKSVKANMRSVKIGLVTVFGSMLGLGASLLLVLLVEFLDPRLKTTEDVRRVARLPVLASLGDLHRLDPEQRKRWAFRTWTMLQGRLSPSSSFGLVCGVTSSAPGEGRSTWIGLLAEAASMAGFRVLTIATRPSPTHMQATEQETSIGLEEASAGDYTSPGTNALTASVLSTPATVTERLTKLDSRPIVHIPLPGWVWNLERRNQWRDALNQWRQIDNLVIFVELPPASVPEAVLLGSNLPNMVWLTEAGKANAAETRTQLETLRNARCNLVGAVLNRDSGTSLRDRFPRWLASGVSLLLLTLNQAAGQDTSTPPTPAAASETPRAAEGGSTNRFLSVVSPSQKATWQQRLTIGPGDVLTLNLYGQPELARAEVALPPDGRLSYLEAENIQAAGLTIDELRARLDEELAKYRRAPRTMITPVAFKSKKYYMLGKVATKGVYTLDRPLTVLEALARAHGLETALVDRHLVNLTDFQRSFLARGGKRIPLSFEQLFLRGDLTQNLPVEPGDYLYFAPGDVQEVYIVGEVRVPGTVTFTQDLTIIGAITQRGGFTERAYKSRVLVIRGPLEQPQAIAVDTRDILKAKQLNFRLEPRDIIYVNSRPFIRVEEALDLAATAFIQSVITSWVGVDVVQPIK